jgi:hypothetical protein
MSLTYNWNIDGHEGFKTLSPTLQKNLAHAYLFSGPKGVGNHGGKIMAFAVRERVLHVRRLQ